MEEKALAGSLLAKVQELEEVQKDIAHRYQLFDMGREAQADALRNHHERLLKLEAK